MKHPARLLPILLALAGPAGAQSSLGQTGTLPPPKPSGSAAPAPAPATTATSPRPKPATPATPTAAKPTPPPAAAKPATPVVQPKPGAAAQPKPAVTAAPKPGAPAATPPQAAAKPQPPRRPAPPAAAAAAGAAAGAATGAAAPAPARPPEPPPVPIARIGTETKLPLPRFAALGSNQVNLRIGPDLRYKIEWTYQRRDLPVQIIDEHQIWRRIRDPEGTEGWVQRPLLNSKRTFLVQGEERVLRRRPEDGAEPVARLKPGVVGTIRSCEAGSAWCEVRVGEYRGWLKRAELWGVTPGEAIN